ncbi:MAG: GYD domain-containing protein [Methanoregula sp.]
MTIYVMLGNLKSTAFANLDSIEERDLKAKKIIESLGGKMISLYYTFGRYDFVVIIDMPSKENMVKLLAIIAKFGTVRTQTLETIPADLFYKIAKEV